MVSIENADNPDDKCSTTVNASSYKSYGWLKKSTIKILGTKYFIVVKDPNTDPQLQIYDGYEDGLLHEIILGDTNLYYKDQIGTFSGIEQKEEYEKHVLKHEIVHAFLDESGLQRDSYISNNGWATNEEMIDWISLQLPKIYKIYEELGLVE